MSSLLNVKNFDFCRPSSQTFFAHSVLHPKVLSPEKGGELSRLGFSGLRLLFTGADWATWSPRAGVYVCWGKG
jgi:hypothetical protein